MFQIARIVALSVVVLLPAGGAAQKSLDPAKPFEGKLGDRKQTVYYRAPGATSGLGSGVMYVSAVPFKRKAGDGLLASATVVGQNRMVGLVVLDPKGKQIYGAGEEVTLAAKKTASITIDEVSADGTYTIIVFSDAIGPFTLVAGSSSEELSKKGLEQKIERLKKELAEAEAALKALEEKSKKQ